MCFKLLVTKFKWKLFWLFRKKSEAKKYLHNADLEHRKVLANIIKSFKVHNLLDVGCGNGSNIYVIQKFINNSDFKFSGIDISSSSISLAKSRKYVFPNKVDFSQVDILNFFKINKNIFDCILFDATLMYLTPKELIRVMKMTSKISNNLIIHELTTKTQTIITKNGFIHDYEGIFQSLKFNYEQKKSVRSDALWKKYGNLFIVKTN